MMSTSSGHITITQTGPAAAVATLAFKPRLSSAQVEPSPRADLSAAEDWQRPSGFVAALQVVVQPVCGRGS